MYPGHRILVAAVAVWLVAFPGPAVADDPTATTTSTVTTTATTTTPSPATTPVAIPRPGSLVLLLADLPKTAGGWRRFGGGIVDNKGAADISQVSVDAVRTAGRQTGFFESFHESVSRIGTHLMIGCCIDNVGVFVDVFATDADADAAFNKTVVEARWHAVRTSSRIGDEVKLFSGWLRPPYNGTGPKETAWQVAWRSGCVVSTLFVGGLLPTAKDALGLARAQQARIAAAQG